MRDDPIVEEIRRGRRDHAKRFGYDLDKIFADLKAKELAYADRLVNLSSKKKSVDPKGRPA